MERLNRSKNLAIKAGWPEADLGLGRDGVYQDGSVSNEIKFELLKSMGWVNTRKFEFHSWCGDVNEGYLCPSRVKNRSTGVELSLSPNLDGSVVARYMNFNGSSYVTKPYKSGEMDQLFREAVQGAMDGLANIRSAIYVSNMDKDPRITKSEKDEQGYFKWLLDGQPVKWQRISSPFFGSMFWYLRENGKPVVN